MGLERLHLLAAGSDNSADAKQASIYSILHPGSGRPHWGFTEHTGSNLCNARLSTGAGAQHQAPLQRGDLCLVIRSGQSAQDRVQPAGQRWYQRLGSTCGRLKEWAADGSSGNGSDSDDSQEAKAHKSKKGRRSVRGAVVAVARVQLVEHDPSGAAGVALWHRQWHQMGVNPKVIDVAFTYIVTFSKVVRITTWTKADVLQELGIADHLQATRRVCAPEKEGHARKRFLLMVERCDAALEDLPDVCEAGVAPATPNADHRPTHTANPVITPSAVLTVPAAQTAHLAGPHTPRVTPGDTDADAAAEPSTSCQRVLFMQPAAAKHKQGRHADADSSDAQECGGGSEMDCDGSSGSCSDDGADSDGDTGSAGESGRHMPYSRHTVRRRVLDDGSSDDDDGDDDPPGHRPLFGHEHDDSEVQQIEDEEEEKEEQQEQQQPQQPQQQPQQQQTATHHLPTPQRPAGSAPPTTQPPSSRFKQRSPGAHTPGCAISPATLRAMQLGTPTEPTLQQRGAGGNKRPLDHMLSQRHAAVVSCAKRLKLDAAGPSGSLQQPCQQAEAMAEATVLPGGGTQAAAKQEQQQQQQPPQQQHHQVKLSRRRPSLRRTRAHPAPAVASPQGDNFVDLTADSDNEGGKDAPDAAGDLEHNQLVAEAAMQQLDTSLRQVSRDGDGQTLPTEPCVTKRADAQEPVQEQPQQLASTMQEQQQQQQQQQQQRGQAQVASQQQPGQPGCRAGQAQEPAERPRKAARTSGSDIILQQRQQQQQHAKPEQQQQQQQDTKLEQQQGQALPGPCGGEAEPLDDTLVFPPWADADTPFSAPAAKALQIWAKGIASAGLPASNAALWVASASNAGAAAPRASKRKGGKAGRSKAAAGSRASARQKAPKATAAVQGRMQTAPRQWSLKSAPRGRYYIVGVDPNTGVPVLEELDAELQRQLEERDQSVAELTRVDFIDDPCDPVNYNPMSRPLGHSEQRARGMLANKLLPAPGPGKKRLLGVYWGTSMTIAEDDYETTRDATMERGMQAAYTHEHSWTRQATAAGATEQQLVVVADKKCRMALINDPRSWAQHMGGSCPRAAKGACTCDKYLHQKSNAMQQECVYKGADGSIVPLLLVLQGEAASIQADEQVLLDYGDSFFQTIEANTLQFNALQAQKLKCAAVRQALACAVLGCSNSDGSSSMHGPSAELMCQALKAVAAALLPSTYQHAEEQAADMQLMRQVLAALEAGAAQQAAAGASVAAAGSSAAAVAAAAAKVPAAGQVGVHEVAALRGLSQQEHHMLLNDLQHAQEQRHSEHMRAADLKRQLDCLRVECSSQQLDRCKELEEQLLQLQKEQQAWQQEQQRLQKAQGELYKQLSAERQAKDVLCKQKVMLADQRAGLQKDKTALEAQVKQGQSELQQASKAAQQAVAAAAARARKQVQEAAARAKAAEATANAKAAEATATAQAAEAAAANAAEATAAAEAKAAAAERRAVGAEALIAAAEKRAAAAEASEAAALQQRLWAGQELIEAQEAKAAEVSKRLAAEKTLRAAEKKLADVREQQRSTWLAVQALTNVGLRQVGQEAEVAGADSAAAGPSGQQASLGVHQEGRAASGAGAGATAAMQEDVAAAPAAAGTAQEAVACSGQVSAPSAAATKHRLQLPRK